LSKVKKFLDNYEVYGTQRNFYVAIQQFLKTFYPETTDENLEQIADKYFNETNRNYEQDIITFLKSLNGKAPLSIKLKLSNVKTFLIEYDVELPLKFWKKISRRIKGSRALTLDRIPTTAELKQIIMHMSIQGKAVYLTLESSGMRIGELLKTELDDIFLNEEPVRIQIRGEVTKTGNSRHVFISQEAKEAIIEWLKVRDDYLKASALKSHFYEKSSDDPRLFPFIVSTSYSMWKKALHKSGLNGRDKSTNREKLHPHVLRKFFRTMLGASGLQTDVIEALMGHEGYLTEVYRKYSLKTLREFYLKGEPSLLVFTDTQKIVEFQETIKKEKVQGLNEHKENILESLKDYRTWYIDQIHLMDDQSESDEVKVSKIDKAIKYLKSNNFPFIRGKLNPQ